MSKKFSFCFLAVLLFSQFCSSQPVGVVYQMGTSFSDKQHNGSCGRQIVYDENGYTQVVWMNALNSSASQRHIYYNLLDDNGTVPFPDGIQVDEVVRAGYATLVVRSDNRAMPVFHQSSPSANSHSVIAFDFMPYIGAFQTVELPWVYQGAVDLEVIWPVSAIDWNDRVHIVSTENPNNPVSEPYGLYYAWAEYDLVSMQINTCAEQQFIAYTDEIASDVAASPVSNRVAVGWLKNTSYGPPDYYRNDLLVCISEDGTTWDWNDPINITQWIPPDLNLLPDTLAAEKDTFRCAGDMSLVFDYNDDLHVFFTVREYHPLYNTVEIGNSLIYHWDEVSQDYSLVANGWFEDPILGNPDGEFLASLPSASIDHETYDIYCVYQRYLDPIGQSGMGYPYQIGNHADTSAAGFPNGEVWISKSVDGGWSWSAGTNLSNSDSPGAPAGECMSEISPGLALTIIDDRLNTFYIMDKSAGGAGTLTLNDVLVQRTMVQQIPAAPLLPNYPMHVEPIIPPSIEVDLTPMGTPIQIPANGGTFNFNIEVTNNLMTPQTFDVWTMAVSPLGQTYGPFIFAEDVFLQMAAIVNRDRTQHVPANAPIGLYTYYAYVGDYPTQVMDFDFFDFEKLGGENTPGSGGEWLNWGEEFSDISASDENAPVGFALHEPYPNPFNPSTIISFEMRDAGFVSLSVYDVQGRQVDCLKYGHLSAGKHEFTFDGSGLSSGMYFAILEAGDFSQTVKLLLMK